MKIFPKRFPPDVLPFYAANLNLTQGHLGKALHSPYYLTCLSGKGRDFYSVLLTVSNWPELGL